MKFTVFFIFVYLVFSGALLGFVKNYSAELCGYHTPITTSDIFGVILWPMAIGAAMAIDDNRNINLCDD